MPEDRTIQVRVTPQTQMAVKLMAGEIQAATGEDLSWGDALWRVLQECKPEVCARAERIAQQQSND